MIVAGSRRSARLKGWWSALAVLVFIVKALIPSGYMLAAVDGHPELVICQPGHDMRSGAPLHSMAGMAHTAGTGHGAHGGQAAGPCPFALAGAAAFRVAVVAIAEPNFVILQPPPAMAPLSVPPAPPARFRAARGPPSLA